MLLEELLVAQALNADGVGIDRIEHLLVMLGAKRNHAFMTATNPADPVGISGNVVNRGRPAANEAGHLGNPGNMLLLESIGFLASLGRYALMLDPLRKLTPWLFALSLERSALLQRRCRLKR